ncbi:MAG TPA: hypothetical protein VN702_01800 [Acetobacteraceae bacterium]|nr:hypothetical protein [Acetobacteraceae bacterium]
MVVRPAVIVHGLADARAALAAGAPVALLSPPGAALYAGCLWWRELVARAAGAFPAADHTDILDCADGSGEAMAALRIGLCRLVLWPSAPGWDAVAAIAARQGGFALRAAPPALDLAARGAMRRLDDWLLGRISANDPGAGDTGPSLG